MNKQRGNDQTPCSGANGVDLDQRRQIAASDQGLHCLIPIRLFSGASTGSGVMKNLEQVR